MKRLILVLVLVLFLVCCVSCDTGLSGHEADESNRQTWYAMCVNTSQTDAQREACERDYGR